MAHHSYTARWINFLAELRRMEKAKRRAEKMAAREVAMKAAEARHGDDATEDTPHD